MGFIRRYVREENKKKLRTNIPPIFKIKETEDITVPPNTKRRRIVTTPK